MSSSTYQKRDNSVIAWVLGSIGYMGLYWKYKRLNGGLRFYICPVIGIVDKRKDFLEKFYSIAKVGNISQKSISKNPKWTWQVSKQKDVRELLERILPDLPDHTKEAELLIEFCKLRDNGNRKKIPYSRRAKEIVRELDALNKRRRLR